MTSTPTDRNTATDTVAEWNARHEVGTAVWYWPGDRTGPRRAGVQQSAARLLCGTPVVHVYGARGPIALTHVEPVQDSDFVAHEAELREFEHDRETTMARQAYVHAIEQAQAAVKGAKSALDELCSDRLYDVEFAEGGQPVADMQHHLDAAARALRAVEALNKTHQPQT